MKISIDWLGFMARTDADRRAFRTCFRRMIFAIITKTSSESLGLPRRTFGASFLDFAVGMDGMKGARRHRNEALLCGNG